MPSCSFGGRQRSRSPNPSGPRRFPSAAGHLSGLSSNWRRAAVPTRRPIAGSCLFSKQHRHACPVYSPVWAEDGGLDPQTLHGFHPLSKRCRTPARFIFLVHDPGNKKPGKRSLPGQKTFDVLTVYCTSKSLRPRRADELELNEL